MGELDRQLLSIMRQMHRNGYDRVFPWMIQARLDYYRAEWTLRKDFMRLVEYGKLERIGGIKCRRGYRIATCN